MPHPRHARPPRPALSSGFTLVELMVAIVILSLMALLSWRGLDGMARSQSITREHSDQLVVVQNALAQWSSDLDALMAIGNTQPLSWDGQVLRLTRRSSQQPEQGAIVVAWALRESGGSQQWLRWQSPPVNTLADWDAAWQRAAQWARTPSSSETQRETRLFPLGEWHLYYFVGGAWANALSSSGGSYAEQTLGGLSKEAASIPEGIRLQIRLPQGMAISGTITQDWVNPLLGGNKS
ncbi:prepilin-type N-terminal cleavage/methylation domain-containing protein [Diaphorobacter ruginosibacter]|uniref:PulJ/GspJ family protein n=1 Tax=Diaphorobacter ruginosibacter TaxID=1715720 RepID=UPI003342C4A4